MPDSNDILIDVRNVSKKFCRDFKKSLWYGVKDTASDLFRAGQSGEQSTESPELRPGEFWANKDTSFQVRRGECLGLIGHNGAGKTTLLKMLNGLIKPDMGSITMKGRIGALIALGAGFNPILTGRENVYVNGSILGLSRKEIDAKLEEIIDFAEIEEAIDAPVRTYSSGMQVRLGFAIAAFMEPDILLIDEVLAVGDLGFRSKCLNFVEGMRQRGGSYILVTHSFNQILTSCEKAALLHHGELVSMGSAEDVVARAINLQSGEDESQGLSRRELAADRPLQIRGITLHPEGSDSLHSGGAALVKIDYESMTTFDEITYAFSIYTHDNANRIAIGTSSDQGVTAEVAPGSGTLTCRIPSLPLAPGRYRLRAFLSDKTSTLDIAGYELTEYFGFDVLATSDVLSLRNATTDSILSLRMEWLTS